MGIQGGRITAVGSISNGARRVIDAEGLVVAPGFIDLHTHSDLPLLRNGNAESKIRQGVTLDVLGEVGSVGPRDGLDNEDRGGGQIIDWTTFTGYFDRVQEQGIAINIISHVAADQVRRVVMGHDTGASTSAQLERMKRLVAKGRKEIVTLIIDNLHSGRDAGKAIAAELGCARIILSNFPGGFDNTETWEKAIDHNIELILEAIGQ